MTTSPLPDRIERLTLLAQSLVGNPSWDELMRMLTLRIFDLWGCEAALLYSVQAKGLLALKAGYGLHDGSEITEIVLSENPELASVISNGRTTWATDSDRTGGLVPIELVRVGGGVVIAPLNRLSIPEYLLVLLFQQPLPDNPASRPFVSSVVSLLELRLAMSQGASPRRVVHATAGEEIAFTKRQQRILVRLRDGKTNKSIARELGFSESTIRQETLRLYRSLGVNSRSDAVLVAGVKGLMPDDSSLAEHDLGDDEH